MRAASFPGVFLLRKILTFGTLVPGVQLTVRQRIVGIRRVF